MSNLQIPLHPDCTAAATPMPRLPLPVLRIARTPLAEQPRAIGRWLEAKVAGDDWDRLPFAEMKDLRTIALLLEAWELPRLWWRFWG